jgi:hypothetical protein
MHCPLMLNAFSIYSLYRFRQRCFTRYRFETGHEVALIQRVVPPQIGGSNNEPAVVRSLTVDRVGQRWSDSGWYEEVVGKMSLPTAPDAAPKTRLQ